MFDQTNSNIFEQRLHKLVRKPSKKKQSLERIKVDVAHIKADVAYIKVDVSKIPFSKDFAKIDVQSFERSIIALPKQHCLKHFE